MDFLYAPIAAVTWQPVRMWCLGALLIFLAIKNTLGSDRLKSFHSHFSKIEYTAGGEKRHLTFDDTVYGPEYEPVMELTYI